MLGRSLKSASSKNHLIIKLYNERNTKMSTDHFLLTHPSARRHMRGLTLLEVMIVVAILGLLASVMVGSAMGMFENSKLQIARLKVKRIRSVVEEYYVSTGVYPTEQEGLKVLTSPPLGLKPFLKVEELKDPWGEELLYTTSTTAHSGSFKIFSKGPDREQGTEDDLF